MILSERPLDSATAAAIRFGFGLPAGPAGGAGLLAGLAAPDTAAARFPMRSMAQVGADLAALSEVRRAERSGEPGAGKARRRIRRRLERNARTQIRAAMARIAEGESGFRERLTWFWANHFSVSVPGQGWEAGPAAFAEEAIRPHVAGQFSDMLTAAETHPMMLHFLDQARSVGPNSRLGQRKGLGLNENLAREVLELHTLGVAGGYRQADVRQLAELLTGLTIGRLEGRTSFRTGRAEPGAETVLGVTYGGDTEARLGDIEAALQDLARHEATAAHLSGKLALHFVADEPDPALVATMTDAWIATRGDLMAVYAAMLDHPAAWAGIGAKVKRPFELVGSALRALGRDGAAVMAMSHKVVRREIEVPMARMGQGFGAAPGPDGWGDRAGDWLHPQGLAARIVWAGETARQEDLAAENASAVLARGLGPAAGETLRLAVARAPTREAALTLVLAAPDFNRR